MKIQFLSRRNHFKLLCLELSKFGFQCDIIPSVNSRNFFSFPTSDFVNAINGDLFVYHNPYHGIYGGSKAKRRNQIKYLSLRLKADYWTESSSNIVPLNSQLMGDYSSNRSYDLRLDFYDSFIKVLILIN